MDHRLPTGLVLLVGLLAPPVSAASAVPTASALTGATTRVSVSTQGAQANAPSNNPLLSSNGRFTFFTSGATNLVPNDTNDVSDVFLHDRQTGATTRVSVATGGAQANGSSAVTSISPDGRYVAFESDAGNLDTSGLPGLFVRDRTAGTTTRVSVSTKGVPANFETHGGAISSDGRFVAFSSMTVGLVPNDTNDEPDVFVHDRQTGITKRVSVATGGAQANKDSSGPSISGDGRYISFMSNATNLVAGDTNGVLDVFLHDQVTGVTSRISVATGGAQANAFSGLPAISADGRQIAFISDATNIVTGATNAGSGVFVHDRMTGRTVMVGQRGYAPKLSGDGRYVAFESFASNLVPGDTNAISDVFVHDQVTGATTRVNISTAGAQANVDSGMSAETAISEDGRYVGFVSQANNLVPGDTNDPRDGGVYVDAFVRDRFAAVPPTPYGDFNGGGWSDLIARQTSTGNLWLYPGNGVRFTAKFRVGTGWNSMSAITRHGDFNRDSHEDILARDKAGVLWLYPGTGSGFTRRVKIGSSGWNTMRQITPIGDLNGDGYPDLMAVQASTGALYLYPGRGSSLGARRPLGYGWNGMSELTGVGDFNHDGHPDLMSRRNATGDLWLYPGTTSGLGAKSRIGTGWNGMRDLTGIGDFDRDGRPDLFAIQSATGKLLLYPGRGTSLGAALQVGIGWTGYRPLV